LAGPDRCELFDPQSMKVTYLDWTPGAPLQFNIKMPGGVPGLEKDIPGDSGLWEYSVKIGDSTTSSCGILAGYKERLYCTISLPKEDANSRRLMNLNINGCDSPIYEIAAYLPGYEAVSGGNNNGSGGGSGSSDGPGTEYGGSCSSSWSQTYCEGVGGTYTTYCICP